LALINGQTESGKFEKFTFGFDHLTIFGFELIFSMIELKFGHKNSDQNR